MDEKKQRHVVTRILIFGGLALILIGALIAVGVRIYIWGTNRIASESQEDLFRQWEEEPADLSTPASPAHTMDMSPRSSGRRSSVIPEGRWRSSTRVSGSSTA